MNQSDRQSSSAARRRRTPSISTRAKKKKLTSSPSDNMDVPDEVVPASDLESAIKMKERLEKRNKARLEDVERRKEAKENQSDAKENVVYFFSTFNDELAAVEELLCACSDADQTAVAQKLDEASSKTVELQKYLNDSMVFLTTYDQRKVQMALQKLQTRLNETREQAMPKKKFGFRGLTKTSTATVKDAVVSPSVERSAAQVDGDPDGPQCGISNISDMVLVKTAEEINKEDVLLSHLSNCKVRLYGTPSTLHLKHIDRCEILCGPVATSVFVDHCQSSTLAVACQQLRTHNTKDTCVYLHVTSRAIVEDCHGVRFAPYTWSYPNLDEDFGAAELDRSCNNWEQVDDFNWLAVGTPSPNWTVIPEADRKTTWDP
ncbi:tubulin-specific chaperone C isoform X1 [Syngnathus scovelli]|uniref:tubulin-specific chaperone C isoform X1 n=1 Tax=Syngnathus scovelli TaxID=161590 RepID=UPI0021104EDF|nr:tubulin-specific chaperone C isoform X1 [Syngnathus scovelli]